MSARTTSFVSSSPCPAVRICASWSPVSSRSSMIGRRFLAGADLREARRHRNAHPGGLCAIREFTQQRAVGACHGDHERGSAGPRGSLRKVTRRADDGHTAQAQVLLGGVVVEEPHGPDRRCGVGEDAAQHVVAEEPRADDDGRLRLIARLARPLREQAGEVPNAVHREKDEGEGEEHRTPRDPDRVAEQDHEDSQQDGLPHHDQSERAHLLEGAVAQPPAVERELKPEQDVQCRRDKGEGQRRRPGRRRHRELETQHHGGDDSERPRAGVHSRGESATPLWGRGNTFRTHRRPPAPRIAPLALSLAWGSAEAQPIHISVRPSRTTEVDSEHGYADLDRHERLPCSRSPPSAPATSAAPRWPNSCSAPVWPIFRGRSPARVPEASRARVCRRRRSPSPLGTGSPTTSQQRIGPANSPPPCWKHLT
ncbi:unnamed protein product [Penicillium discolor]